MPTIQRFSTSSKYVVSYGVIKLTFLVFDSLNASFKLIFYCFIVILLCFGTLSCDNPIQFTFLTKFVFDVI